MPRNNGEEPDNVTWFSMLDEEPLSDEIDLENYQIDHPPVVFEFSLEAIQADALAPNDLLGFANISRKQIHELRAVWNNLAVEQRETLAELALLVAREQPYADFGRFFQVLLDDSSVNVRLTAATAAAMSEDEGLIRPLIEHAESDPDISVREAALVALGPQVVGLDAGVIADRKDQERLFRLKAWALDVSWPTSLRAAALQAYSHFQMDDDTAGIIESFVTADDDALHLGAMRAMAEYGAGQFTRFLERQLQSQDVDSREAAAAAMGMSNDEAIVPMLTMVARTDDEPAVREAAYLALANFGSDSALESLVQLRQHASDDEIDIIDGAIQYITEIKELEDLEGFDMFEFGDDADGEN